METSAALPRARHGASAFGAAILAALLSAGASLAQGASQPPTPSSGPQGSDKHAQTTKPKQNTAADQRDTNQPAPAVIAPVSKAAEKPTYQQPAYVQQAPHEDRTAEVAAIVTTGVATVVIAIFTALLYRATNGLLLADGPRIVFTDTAYQKMGTGYTGNGPTRTLVAYTINFKNCGRAPAVLKEIRVRVSLDKRMPLFPQRFFNHHDAQYRPLPYTLIPDDSHKRMSFNIELPQIEYEATKAAGGVVIGTQILYASIDGRTHITRQCKRLTPDGVEGGWYGDRRYNKHT